MTVKELKEILEALINQGLENSIVVFDNENVEFEVDGYNILEDKKIKLW
ncbi:hypothetical protein [Clostridium sp.]|nr:hypothetical protein [Clostridium sp.]MBK5239790.1 hypothetical protein [Clostridium sp.]